MTAQNQPDLDDVAGDFVATRSGRLYVRVWGLMERIAQCIPIVLLHDSLGSVALWRDLPERLALRTGRTVIAYDRLGFGRSDPHSRLLDKDYIEHEPGSGLRDVRQALGIDRLVLIGHSGGGAMSIAAAAEFPASVAAAVILGITSFVEEPLVQGILRTRATFDTADQMKRLERYHGAKSRWVLDSWTGVWGSPAFARWSLEQSAKRVSCPVLVIHGTEDEYCSSSTLDHLKGGSQRRPSSSSSSIAAISRIVTSLTEPLRQSVPFSRPGVSD